MTAKEKLHHLVEDLTEAEAAEALDILAHRRGGDALERFLAEAPLDDEPTSPEEEALVAEAYEEIARGEVVSADEIRREFG